jgi:hypothetical protein
MAFDSSTHCVAAILQASPVFEYPLRLRQAIEELCVETFSAKCAAVRINEGIIQRGKTRSKKQHTRQTQLEF